MKYSRKSRKRIAFILYKFFISLFRKNVKQENELQTIAEIVMKSLMELSMFNSKNQHEYFVKMETLEERYFRFSLHAGTRRDNELFLESLSQVFEPLGRPKYIIVIHFLGQHEIFALPHRFAVNKASAEHYFKIWKSHFIEFKHMELLSTHQERGQEYLLKAKARYYKEQNEEKLKLIERWE